MLFAYKLNPYRSFTHYGRGGGRVCPVAVVAAAVRAHTYTYRWYATLTFARYAVIYDFTRMFVVGGVVRDATGFGHTRGPPRCPPSGALARSSLIVDPSPLLNIVIIICV